MFTTNYFYLIVLFLLKCILINLLNGLGSAQKLAILVRASTGHGNEHVQVHQTELISTPVNKIMLVNMS